MTNLQYLQWFLEEMFGAICFRNDIQDGYVKYPKSCEKEIETLSIYFPNEIDLHNPDLKNRLTKAVGPDFYKRYIGAKGLKISPVSGSTIITQFKIKDKVLDIQNFNGLLCSHQLIYYIIGYFIGDVICHEYPLKFDLNSFITNNEFKISKGDDMKVNLEKFLVSNNLPVISKENNFYICPINEISINEKIIKIKDDSLQILVHKEFEEDIKNIKKIIETRNAKFKQSLDLLDKSDWEKFKHIINADMKITKNPEFDD